MQASNPIAVFIADDHRVVREGLKSFLAGSEINIVGEAADGTQLHEMLLYQETPVDVLLLDLKMPHLDPVSFVKTLKSRRPEVRILALTGVPDLRTIEALLQNQVDGCLLKTASTDLLDPIRIVAQGGLFISPETRQFLSDFQHRERSPETQPIDLAERDLTLLKLIAQGHGNDEIAKRVNLERTTINNYISRLYSTIGVQNRSQATLWAIKHGIVDV